MQCKEDLASKAQQCDWNPRTCCIRSREGSTGKGPVSTGNDQEGPVMTSDLSERRTAAPPAAHGAPLSTAPALARHALVAAPPARPLSRHPALLILQALAVVEMTAAATHREGTLLTSELRGTSPQSGK